MGIAINSGNTGAAQNSQNQTQSVQEESKSRRQKHRSSITRMDKAAGTAGKATGANGKNLTLSAGNITGRGSQLESRIQQKRDQARKQAMKLINDAWDADKKAADGIDALNKDKQNQLNRLSEYKQSLKEAVNYDDVLGCIMQGILEVSKTVIDFTKTAFVCKSKNCVLIDGDSSVIIDVKTTLAQNS